MEKKITKKIVAILMIITILATDFFVLGSSLITYAAQVVNEIEGYSNVHFSTYFKDGESEIKEINQSIENKRLKLYAKIGVKSDVDCLEDIQLNLKDCNFNLISSDKGTVEGNTVKLDYIGAETSVEVELEVEPVFSDKISADMSLKTNIEVNARYKHADAPEGETITALSECIVTYLPQETMSAKLETKIITNKVLEVSGTPKRIVQLLIKSKLTDNQYPVEKTTINVSIPQLGEQAPEVNVLAIDKLATNGTTEINSVTTENGNVVITLNNNMDENGQISWLKDAYDEMIVTFAYPSSVNTSGVDILISSNIKLYNLENPLVVDPVQATAESNDFSQVIIGKTEITTEEIYKGKIYANIDKTYNTKTTLVVTNANVSNNIVIHETPDTFGTANQEITANAKYLKTEINKEKMLAILDDGASIQIKSGETIINTITKDTEANTEGNIVIDYTTYTTNFNELDIVITGQQKAIGTLEINHLKAIIGNVYSKEQLETVKNLNTKNITSAKLNETKVVENATEISTIELKETTTKAELTIENNKTKWSTTEPNAVTLGVTLVTESEKYDLHNNAEITLQFPQSVENVEFNESPILQNANGLILSEYDTFDKNDKNDKTITIKLAEKQKEYSMSAETQTYLQFNLNVTLSKLTATHNDVITMNYSNENAIQYDGGKTDCGVTQKAIEISGLGKLATMFNVNSNINTSLDKEIKQQITSEDAGKEVEFTTILFNDTGLDINNVRILGNLPTVGFEGNSLETTLTSISAENATIYYSENINETENTDDGWSTEFTTNAKKYLIKFDTLNNANSYTILTKVKMPDIIQEGLESYTKYEVIYDTDTTTNQKVSSRKIGLVTYAVSELDIDLTAKVGQEKLNEGDKVKEGEVIRYTATITNTSETKSFENVELKLGVPEGTVFVSPIEKYTFNQGTENEYVIEDGAYVYIPNVYYEEITDSDILAEKTSIMISELLPGASKEIQYEVRVKTDNVENTEISNEVTLQYNGSKVGNIDFKNIIEESNVRVTIKRTIEKSAQLLAGGKTRYKVYVENLSDSVINNLEMQILSDVFNVLTIENSEMYIDSRSLTEKIIIEKIDANSLLDFTVYGSIDNDVQEMNTSVLVSDENGNRYRSNALLEILPNTDATINLTSSKNHDYIKNEDIVEFVIDVQNTGDIESDITIDGEIPDHFDIQAIYMNEQLIEQKTDGKIINSILKSIELKPEETAQLKIIAKVGYISEMYHGKVISNYVEAKIGGIVEEVSGMVTHILVADLLEDEKIENVINGFAWFDKNGNGQKDENENGLSEITVRLYDISNNCYLIDENLDLVETKTDSNGQYTFTKIKDGSYLIVFEYDMNQYKHTISFAEGVDTTINSKALLKTANIEGKDIPVIAIEANDLQTNTFSMNIGLTEGEEDLPFDENPENPELPNDPENPEQPQDKKIISGFAWLDSNRNGLKDTTETVLSGIKVKLYDISTKNYLTDASGNIVEITTDANGKYTFENIEKGSYIVIFEYDIEKYEPTVYLAEGVDTSINSKVVLKKISINGQEIMVAVTDTIDVQNNVTGINIGLKESLVFDLELNKYISRIVVQNKKGTKAYDYENKTLGKVEIHKKQIQDSLVVLEYTIEVKNNGEIAGYARNIVDYLPSGLTFSSELNKDWYLSGNYLYTKSLENIELKPGEEKELKLILTKTMTSENVGLINNRAEIYQDYNQYGESDIDSTPNNQIQNEDDFGAVDVIIQIATGGSGITYAILIFINIVLIGIAIKLMFQNNIIKRPTKKERR